MGKKQIPIIVYALALFSVIILLAYGNIEKVYAVTLTKVVSTTEPIISTFADFNSSTLWVLTDGGVTAGDTFVYGCNVNTNSACIRYNISGNYNTNNLRTPQDLWCGRTHCFVTFGASTSLAAEYPNGGNLLRFQTITAGGFNKGQIVTPIVNRTNGGLYQIDGKDSLTGGFGGVNIWADACNVDHLNGTCRHTIILYDGVTMGASFVFPEYTTGNGHARASDVEWNGLSGANSLLAVGLSAIYDADPTNVGLVVYNTATFSKFCDRFSVSQISSTMGVSGLDWSKGTNDPLRRMLYFAGASNAGAGEAHLMHYNTTSCSTSAGTLYTSATTGLSDLTGMRDLIILQDQDIMLLQEAGANARIASLPFNDVTGAVSTQTSLSDTFPTTSQDRYLGEFTIRRTFNNDGTETDLTNKIWIPFSGADKVNLFIDFGAAPPATGATVCIDTTGDTQTDVCFTDTNNDGVADAGVGGALAVYRSTANVTQFGSDLGCAFGFNSMCTDKNIKTNGVGLAYLAIIIIWSYAFLVFIHYQAKKVAGEQNIHLTEILNIHPMLLVVMLLMDVGITFYLGWIPDLVFYTTILTLIGFFAFGVYRHLRSGG